MAEGALRNTATRWAWPTSRLSGRVTARRGTSNGSSKAISGRLEHLRASALGSRILTKHIARRLPTSEGQGPTTPLIGMSPFGRWELTAPGITDPVPHIARDPLDPDFDVEAVARRIRTKRSEIKRVLLDQTVVSGIGNIYADEALWAAQVHPRKRATAMRQRDVVAVLDAAAVVMIRALAAGGTSFDDLYVNVNGASGYFSRSLNAYGRTGEPCPRCGTPVVREQWMNRSSHFCPECQRR